MNPSQLRNDFHKLIDSFKDIKMLEHIYEVVSDYQSRKTKFDILDELTDAQQARLTSSIEQAQKGRTMSHDDVKSKVKTWPTK